MEDFIYLVILVAWVAFAFYRKSQKKAEAARKAQETYAPPPEYKPMPTLEDLLMGEDEPYDEEPAPRPAFEVISTPVAIPKPKETAFEREYNLRGLSSIEELDKQLRTSAAISADDLTLSTGAEATTSPYTEKLRDNLREAVIYAEILKRPYD